MLKADKRLYMFFRIMKTTNDDNMKEFDAYIKFINYYGGKTPIHPSLVESNLAKMGVQDYNNPAPE